MYIVRRYDCYDLHIDVDAIFTCNRDSLYRKVAYLVCMSI